MDWVLPVCAQLAALGAVVWVTRKIEAGALASSLIIGGYLLWDLATYLMLVNS